MRFDRKKLIATAVAATLLGSSTIAAAAPAPQAPANPWVTLSMLNPAGATALGGAAAQGAVYDDNASRPFSPPLPVIAVWLAVIALNIYILTANNHGHGHIHVDFPPPVSPD